MTISSETRLAGPFVGNDATTALPFTFKVFAASDLLVVTVDTTTEVETTLTLTTDYTVSLNGDQDANPGGTVNLTSPLPTGTNAVVTSAVGYLQETRLTNQGGFYPRVINDSLDRLTIQVQQLREIVGRTLQSPVTAGMDTLILPKADVRASKALGFSAVGKPVVSEATLTEIDATVASWRAIPESSAAGVRFKSSETDSIERTVQDKLRDTLSVKDFGAVGDGIADDTEFIQKAIDAVIGLTGRTLLFPAGTYKITDAINVAQGVGFRLVGERGQTVLKQHTSNKPILLFDTTDTHSFEISGITFDYATQQGYSTDTLGNALVFSGALTQFYNFNINFCSFDNCRRAITSAGTAVVWGYMIEQCWFHEDMTGAAIAFTTSVGQPNVAVRGVYIQNDSAEESNIILTSAETVLLQNVEVNHGVFNARHAMLLTTCSSVTILACKVENVELNSSALFSLPQCNATVIGCTFLLIVGTRSASQAFVKSDTSGVLSVIGCKFVNSVAGNCFPFIASRLNLVSGNVYLGNFHSDWTGFGLDAPRLLADAAGSFALRSPIIDLPRIRIRSAAPAAPANGDIAYANGAGWDPGSGAGFYGYENGAWVKF